MSCQIMSPEPMAAIANAAETLLNCGFDYFGFDVPTELIDACAGCCDNPRACRPFFAARDIYRKMYAVNIAAYNARYAHILDEPADENAPDIEGSVYIVHQPPQYGEHRVAVRPWHYKLAMLLDFWLYQTNESITRTDPFRLGIKSFRDALFMFIVRNSDEYQANKWGELQPAKPQNSASDTCSQNADAQYPELEAYTEAAVDLVREPDDIPADELGRYEVIFEVEGCRYYCFIDAINMNEALGQFFRYHPNLTYNNVIEYVEV